MTTRQRLETNLRLAQTIHDREQVNGARDMSVRQTRRMYFASMALMRAGGALQRFTVSASIVGEQHARS